MKQTEEKTLSKPDPKTAKKSVIFPDFKIPKKDLKLTNMFEKSDRVKKNNKRTKKTPAPTPEVKAPKIDPKVTETELAEACKDLEVRYIKNIKYLKDCQQEHVLFSSTPSIVNGI